MLLTSNNITNSPCNQTQNFELKSQHFLRASHADTHRGSGFISRNSPSCSSSEYYEHRGSIHPIGFGLPLPYCPSLSLSNSLRTSISISYEQDLLQSLLMNLLMLYLSAITQRYATKSGFQTYSQYGSYV